MSEARDGAEDNPKAPTAPPSTGSSELLEEDSDDSSEWEEHGDVAGDPRGGGGDVALASSSSLARASTAPSAVYVQESSDVQLGPRTVYEAPVTINQHVHVTRSAPLSPDDLQQVLKTPGGPEVPANGFVRYESWSPTVAAAATPAKEKKLFGARPFFWGLLGAAALLSLAAVITVYSQQASSSSQGAPGYLPGNTKNLPTIPPLDDPFNPNRTLPNQHRIFSKESWGGYDAKYTQRLIHPTKYVVISHTVTNLCFDSKTCSAQVRNIQNDALSKPEYADIPYSFLVGADGNVYEGRGWDVITAHSGFVQNKNIGVSFIGNFVVHSPTYVQLESAQQLLELGVKLGKIDENYRLVAHNQTFNTLSPGHNLYGIISKWPHFYVPSEEDPV